MIVLITNVTDAPEGKHSPRQVDIYNKTLNPGESTRIPAELVDERVRNLETAGLLAIGALPSWYQAAKSRTGKRLTVEEKNRLIVRKPKKEKSVKTEASEGKKVEEVVPEDINRKR